ncbi:hypothetical protein OAO87_02320 [bacterium]|nr:hypothetical protein [bacterium]
MQAWPWLRGAKKAAHGAILLRARRHGLLHGGGLVADELGERVAGGRHALLGHALLEGLPLGRRRRRAADTQRLRAQVDDEFSVGRGARLGLERDGRVEAEHGERSGVLRHARLQREHLDLLRAKVARRHIQPRLENEVDKGAQRVDVPRHIKRKEVGEGVLGLACRPALDTDAVHRVQVRVVGANAEEDHLCVVAGDEQRLWWRRRHGRRRRVRLARRRGPQRLVPLFCLHRSSPLSRPLCLRARHVHARSRKGNEITELYGHQGG